MAIGHFFIDQWPRPNGQQNPKGPRTNKTRQPCPLGSLEKPALYNGMATQNPLQSSVDMDFLKTLGGKIATGLVSLAVLAAGVSWWQADPSTRHAILATSGRLAGWTGVVLMVPWAGFWVLGWLARLQSNRAGAAFLLALTGIEATMLAWLFNWSIHSPSGWTLYAAAILIAGVYNLFTCDWIAEKAE